MECAVFQTRFGWAGVCATGEGISRLVLPKKNKKEAESELSCGEFGVPGQQTGNPSAHCILAKAATLLKKYFSGKRVLFDLPLDMRYHTAFQRKVWQAAAAIPYGETRSYAWIAKRIKKPKAARAVGQALGANPVPLIIPCHRVVSSTGALGGFSGGIGMKELLLHLEIENA